MRTTHLPIANPCHEDWDAMDPDARGRFCQVCVKPVHDLSGMSEPEARDVLAQAAGSRICVRYAHDTQGRIRFREPPAPRTCRSPWRLPSLGAAAVAMAMAACTPHEHPSAHGIDPVETTAPPSSTMNMTVSIPEGALPPVERHVKGEMVAIEPPPVESEWIESQGDVPAPTIRKTKGDVAVAPSPENVGILGTLMVPPRDEPCDPERGG